MISSNESQMEGIRNTLEEKISNLQESNIKKLVETKEKTSTTLTEGLRDIRNTFDKKIQLFEDKLEKLTTINAEKMKSMTETLERNLSSLQKENGIKLEENKEKTSKTIRDGLQDVRNIFDQKIQSFEGKLEKLTLSNEEKMKKMTETIETKLNTLRQENSKKLEEMRQTVDEKLNSTLEQRLGEKFKLVSDRLEQVHNGLGEMKALATGVGDLKKVLTNVKTKGIWGEIQLGNILAEVLTTDQYVENVATKKNSNDRVEFAIKIPSKQDSEKFIYLPVDSKFPNEIYEHLMTAQESENVEAVKESIKQLETRIKLEAKTIHDKYISPPDTTDFAVLFVPTESLYAEVLKIQGLVEFIQNTYRVTVTGPTTMAAFLNSLQMGFRTLAIQKRSSEVWETLGKVKTEFGKFGDIIEKTQKKLQEASNNMDKVAVRTRAIQRNLNKVEELPSEEKEFSGLLD
nr:DNA recombination protein RmuC [Sporolactobacillus kofuensis]